jgi:hypothetical protein
VQKRRRRSRSGKTKWEEEEEEEEEESAEGLGEQIKGEERRKKRRIEGEWRKD